MAGSEIFNGMINLVCREINLNPIFVGIDDRKKAVFSAAVYHAISEFTIGSSASFNNEEHRTSSLMAYLGASLSWYNFFSHLDGSDAEQLSILWNPQNKSGKDGVVGEDLTGGDFGIAIKTIDDKYNLIFFQAKRNKPVGGKIRLAVNQVPSGYYDKGFSEIGSKANDNCFVWALYGILVGRKSKAEHQVVKLANQEGYPFGREFRNKFPSTKIVKSGWAHYVVWSDVPDEELEESKALRYKFLEPRTTSLSEVKKALKGKWDVEVKKKDFEIDALFGSEGIKGGPQFVDVTNAPQSFAELLISGLDDGANGWLGVTLDEARNIVGHFTQLGVHWSFIEGSGAGPTLAASMGASVCKPILNLDSTQDKAATSAALASAITKIKPTRGV